MTSLIIGYTAGLGTLIVFWVAGFILRPWARAFFSGAKVPLATIIGMRFRGTNPWLVIDAYIRLVKRNMKPSIDQIEAMYIAYGERIRTAEELIDLVTDESRR